MNAFQSIRCSHQCLAERLARICDERAESAHSNLQLSNMFEVRNRITDAHNSRIDISDRVTQAIMWSKRAQYGVLFEKTVKKCLKKSSLPSKAFFVRRICLRSPKKTCEFTELSTRNYGPFEDRVRLC